MGHKTIFTSEKGEKLVKNKDKPWWKRLLAKITALVAAVCMMLLPATAHADMQGVDMSNWQCGIDIANTQADFVVVGTTWGTGQVYNNCLVSGVNTDANRMIAQAQASGKKFGLYHYAMGGNPEAEAQFFYRNTSNYWRHGIVALDWEMDDNPAWGNWDWVRRFMAECERLSGGVKPLLYTGPVAGTIPGDIRANYGLWIAQYANMSRPAIRPTRGCWARTARPCDSTAAPVSSTRGVPSTSTSSVATHGSGTCTPTRPAAPRHRPHRPRPHSRTLPRPTPTLVASARHAMGRNHLGLAVAYDAWPLSAWHTPSGDINRYYVGDVVTYGGGTAPASSGGSPRSSSGATPCGISPPLTATASPSVRSPAATSTSTTWRCGDLPLKPTDAVTRLCG